MNTFKALAANAILRIMAWSQIDAAQFSNKRPIRPVQFQEFKKQFSPQDFRTLLSHSNGLYLNLGPAKGAICDKAVYTVGRAWRPRYTGTDKNNADWGKRATELLTQQWYGACEVSGNMMDFVTCLLLICIAIDRDGDCGILLTEGANGYPMIQLIPAQRIWSDNSNVAPEGFTWDKGVLYSNAGYPVKYFIKDSKGNGGIEVDAQDFIHIYDPEFFGQGRGLPAFTHAILDLQDYQTIQGFEKRATMLASSIALLETNEDGAPDPSDFKAQVDQLKQCGFIQEQFEDGGIRHYKAGSGGKLEAFQHERPGTATTDFLDRLLRNSLAGIQWPYELLWDASDAKGANIRAIVARAARTVEDRQDLIRAVARRIIGYVIAKYIKNGALPPCEEWYKWDFTMPPHISVDAGYDAEADRQDYVLGFKNLADILSKYGKDVESHLRERAEEWQLIEQIAQEYGITTDKLINIALLIKQAQAAPPQSQKE